MPQSTKNRHQAILEEAEAESGWQNSIMDGLRYVGGEETTKMLNNMETSKANISMMTSAPSAAMSLVSSTSLSSMISSIWPMIKATFEKSVIGAIGHNADAMTMFANAKIFYNAFMEMPNCIEQTKIPGVCVKYTTFDVVTLANAYTGCGDNDEECKTSSLDGDPTYGDPPEGQNSFSVNFFKLNIENTIF